MNFPASPFLRRPAVAAPSAPSTLLPPEDPFPLVLAELELAELQVLHSRVSRQLEQEYLTDPEGPHPVTRDRCQELADELDTRQGFLAPDGQGFPGSPEAPEAPDDAPAPTPAREGTVDAPQETADEVGARIHDLSEVHPGDVIELWHDGLRHCRGTVEEVCPALGVVWVHEAGDGYRRMLHAQDAELRRHATR